MQIVRLHADGSALMPALFDLERLLKLGGSLALAPVAPGSTRPAARSSTA